MVELGLTFVVLLVMANLTFIESLSSFHQRHILNLSTKGCGTIYRNILLQLNVEG